MNTPISVNQAIDKLADLVGQDVLIRGLLHFDFEDVAIYHCPITERREGYESSVWISTGMGSLGFDKEVCKRLHGKQVKVAGKLVKPDPAFGGCGHMNLWPAELLARTVERV